MTGCKVIVVIIKGLCKILVSLVEILLAFYEIAMAHP